MRPSQNTTITLPPIQATILTLQSHHPKSIFRMSLSLTLSLSLVFFWVRVYELSVNKSDHYESNKLICPKPNMSHHFICSCYFYYRLPHLSNKWCKTIEIHHLTEFLDFHLKGIINRIKIQSNKIQKTATTTTIIKKYATSQQTIQTFVKSLRL